MIRKKYTPVEEVTEAVKRAREKRKWQIAYRRYVIERQASASYAPFFGLDIIHLRDWFERQFTERMQWEGFGKSWQFGHIIPVTYFDFSNEDDLRLCWNFINMRVEPLDSENDVVPRIEIIAAKAYFQRIYQDTGYETSQRLLEKLDSIERTNQIELDIQRNFLLEKGAYLNSIERFGQYEFQMLNKGRSVDEIQREMDLIQNLGKAK